MDSMTASIVGSTAARFLARFIITAGLLAASCASSSKPGIGIAKPTGLTRIGNCVRFKNPKHDPFENSSSLHTFSSGLIWLSVSPFQID